MDKHNECVTVDLYSTRTETEIRRVVLLVTLVLKDLSALCVSLSQLLYTLTFWLLLRQSVKDSFRKKKSITAPLIEVTTGGKQHFYLLQSRTNRPVMGINFGLDVQMDSTPLSD